MLEPVTDKRSKGTKVKITGFEWLVASKTHTPKGLCEYLERNSGLTRDKTKIFCKKKGNVYVGLVVTINDMKAFTTWEKQGGGSYALKINELEDGKNMADFNYFIIFPGTGRGLYQYYHKSSTLNTFCQTCKRLCEEMKKEAIQSQAEETCRINKIPKLTKKEQNEIRKKNALKFSYSQLMKAENFETFIKTMTDIKSFEFEFSTVDAQDVSRVAFSKYADRIVHRMHFQNVTDRISSIRSSFTSLLPQLNSAKVVGMDPDHVEQTFKLDKNYEVFSEYDFNDVVSTVTLDTSNIDNSLTSAPMIVEMIKVFNQSTTKALITTPIRQANGLPN